MVSSITKQLAQVDGLANRHRVASNVARGALIAACAVGGAYGSVRASFNDPLYKPWSHLVAALASAVLGYGAHKVLVSDRLTLAGNAAELELQKGEMTALQAMKEDHLHQSFMERYEVKRPLGQGGMASTILAYDRRLDLDVVLKIPLEGSLNDPATIARFESAEARNQARLVIEGVVHLYDLGRLSPKTFTALTGRPLHSFNGSIPYITMEFMPSGTLENIVEKKQQQEGVNHFPVDYVLDLAISIGETLLSVHREGIVHRDLKPDNIFVYRTEGEDRDRFKIGDWGLAKYVRRDLGKKSLKLTQAYKQGVFGTPLYMSPEVWRGEEADWRADYYALAVIVFELITGRAPYPIKPTDDASAYGRRVMDENIPLPDFAFLGEPLSDFFTKAFQKKAENRHPSARVFVDELRQIRRNHLLQFGQTNFSLSMVNIGGKNDQ
ncbi:MAG: serine/threonine-protein kinase [Candidatus Margulisiibacteriota bacterium]